MPAAYNCRPVDAKPRLASFRAEAETLTREQLDLLARRGLLSTTVYLEEDLRTFLDNVLGESRADPPRSLVMLLTAPWGQGKSLVGRSILAKLAGEKGVGYKYYSFEEFAETVYRELVSHKGPVNIEEYLRGKVLDLLEEALRENNGRTTIVFLDEVEAFVEAYRRILAGEPLGLGPSRIALGLVEELLMVAKELMRGSREAARGLAGKVHLVLALTPEASLWLRRLFAEKGLEGRIFRRVVEKQIPPITRRDAEKIVMLIMEDYHGLPSSFVDRSLVNTLYLVSRGNPGILVQLVNSIVYEAYTLCRYYEKRDCVCRLEGKALLQVLSRVEIPYVPGYQQSTPLLDPAFAEKLAEAAEADPSLGAAIARLLVLLEPIPATNIYRFEHVLAELGVPLNTYYAYHGVNGEKLDEIVNALAVKHSTRIHRHFVREVVELLAPRTGDAYTVLVPASERDADELLFFATSVLGTSIDRAAFRNLLEDLVAELEGEGFEPREALHPSPTGLWRIFPSLVAAGVPFLADPVEAARLLREVRELKRSDPEAYARFLLQGLARVLERGGLAKKGPGKTHYYLLRGVYDTVYSVPLELASEAPRPSRGEDAEPRIVVVPRRPGSYTPTPSKPPVVVASIDLGVYEEDSLAVLGALLEGDGEEPRSLNERLFEEFSQLISSRLDSSEAIEKARREFVERGIAVPYLVRRERVERGYSVLDFYRAVMVGGRVLEPRSTAWKLYHLYRLRPYKKGRMTTWCGIRVPSMLSVDLEPEDYRAYYDEAARKRYLAWLEERVRAFIEAAEDDWLVERRGESVQLRLHPVSDRMKRVLKSLGGGAGLDELKRFFVFPEPLEQRRSAERLFDEFFAELLVASGEAERAKNGLKLVALPARHSLSALRARIEAELERRVLAPLRSLLAHCGLDQELASRAATLIVFKERGVKTIDPDAIIASLGELDYAPPSVVGELEELLKGYMGLMAKNSERLAAELSRVKTAIEDLLREYGEGARLAKRLVPGFEASPRPRGIGGFEPCKVLGEALSEQRELLDSLVKTPPNRLGEEYGELRRVFHYENCGNEYGYSLALYLLKKRVDKGVEELVALKDRIRSARERLQGLLGRASTGECLAEVERATARIRASRAGSVEELVAVLDKLSRVVETVVEECKTCLEERRRIERANTRAEKALDLQDRLDIEVDALISSAESYIEGLEKLVGQNLVEKVFVEELRAKTLRLRDARHRLYSKLQELYTEASRRLGEAERLTCKDLDHLRLLGEKLGEISRRIDEAEAGVERLRHGALEVLEAVADRLEKVIDLLEEEYTVLEALAQRVESVREAIRVGKELEEARRALKRAREIVDAIRRGGSAEDPSEAVLEAVEALGRLREALRETIVADIGVNAYAVLQALWSKKPHGKRLSEIVEEIVEETGLPVEEVLRALHVIDTKNYYPVRLT